MALMVVATAVVATAAAATAAAVIVAAAVAAAATAVVGAVVAAVVVAVAAFVAVAVAAALGRLERLPHALPLLLRAAVAQVPLQLPGGSRSLHAEDYGLAHSFPGASYATWSLEWIGEWEPHQSYSASQSLQAQPNYGDLERDL